MQANGTFDVESQPAEVTPLEKQAGIGRNTLDKTWHGDLAGHSTGAMLWSSTESSGAMAYVALERFTGTLKGKAGSVDFSHMATMIRGDAASSSMKIIVVPGSGTGELAGLAGELVIHIDAEGGHSYTFDDRHEGR